MTSTPVMSSESLFNINFMNQTSKTSKSDLGDFKDFLNQSQMNGNDANVKNVVKKPLVTKKENQTGTENSKKVTNKLSETDSVSDVQKEGENAKVSDVKDAVQEVVDSIKEELDVTDEDIINALSALGLTFVALLDEDMMPKIVATLTDEPDTLSIATNQDLYDSLTNILDTVEKAVNELADGLEIPEEELKEAIKINEDVPKEENHSFSEVLDKNVSKKEVSDEKSLEEKVTIVDNRETKTAETKTTDNKVENDVKTTTEVNKPEPKKEEAHESKHEARDNSFTGFVNNIIQKAVESLNGENKVETFTTFDAKNVLNQITESIKFDLSNDINEVNLRLHPETLGTVNVKVTTNSEGIMTAQFTAQNEQVKTIIENQAVVLRETLEAKGVTVEAVEVLVQSHEFERNLNEQNKGQEENKGSKKTHRINLLDDGEIETEISDGDEIIRKMMEQNGNTIDYSA